MKKAKIYAYMFDCHEFKYDNHIITGLCCAIKTTIDIPDEELHKYVSIKISKEGFHIILNGEAKNICIQPYKLYALALCDNNEEDLIEIESSIITENNSFIIESISNCAESSWIIDV